MPKAKAKKTPAKNDRTSDAEIERRVTKIFDMMVKGVNRPNILQFVSTLDWGVTERTVDNYIKRAKVLLAEQSKVDRDEALGLAVVRINDLFEKTSKIQDYKTALAVQKELNALLNLYPPKRTEIANATDKDGKSIPFILKTGQDFDEL